jgi:hypothetical protein
MPVVINEMEVAPQTTEAASSTQSSQGAPAAGSKDKLKQMERALHKKRQRADRLEAY